MKQYVFTGLVLLLAALVGFTVPPVFMQQQDMLRLKKKNYEAAEEVVLTARTQLTMTEKLQLIQSDTVRALSIVQGKNYNENSIVVQVQQELEKLQKLKILELERLDNTYGCSANFLVDTESGSRSMILWTVTVETADCKIVLQVDDETGKILSIRQTSRFKSVSYVEIQIGGDEKEPYDSVKIAEYQTDEEYQQKLKEAAENWSRYLGIELVETYQEQNPAENYEKCAEKDAETLMENGMSKEEAYQIAHGWWSQWNESGGRQIFGTYEDEKGRVVYVFRIDFGTIDFAVDLFQ